MLNETTGPYFAYFMIFMILEIASLIVAILLPRKSFRRSHQGKRYSYLSDFPFELYEARDAKSKVGQGFLIGYAASALGFAFFPLLLCKFSPFEGFFALFLVHLLLTAGEVGLNFYLTIVSAINPKRHTLIFTIYGGLTLIRFVVDGLIIINVGHHFQGYQVPSGNALGFLIPLFVFALGFAVLLMSPQMGKWAELHSTMNQDGSTYCTRPKFFILAATEWFALLANVLCDLLFASPLLFYFLKIAEFLE